MVKIKYVTKKALFPAFGLANFETKTVYIRKDLPKLAREFVLQHELYHIKDYDSLTKRKEGYSVFKGEIKANFFPFLKDPMGGIITLILSLNPKRIKFYVDLYITKKINLEDIEKRAAKQR